MSKPQDISKMEIVKEDFEIFALSGTCTGRQRFTQYKKQLSKGFAWLKDEPRGVHNETLTNVVSALLTMLIYTRRLWTYLTQGTSSVILQAKERARAEESPGTGMFVLQLT